MINPKSLFFVVIFLFSAVCINAQSEEFKTPWAEESKALLIDPYQGNDIEWDKLKADKRVGAIIHRATIKDRADTKYASRKMEARQRGYLWGSYHLGLTGDPIKQADFYLTIAKPFDDELRWFN